MQHFSRLSSIHSFIGIPSDSDYDRQTLTKKMAAHLSHKIRWDFLVDYLSPYVDPGITLPVGECGRIHVAKRKQEIQVEMRNYITDDMVCSAENCETTGERAFRKNDKKRPPFTPGGHRDEKKLEMFAESFYKAIEEFASTELTSPAKRVEYDATSKDEGLSTSWCNQCDEFINHLEFGDKQKIFEYSDSQLRDIFSCQHGGQAVGNSIRFFLYHISRFYVLSNAVMYSGLKEDQWPDMLKRFRDDVSSACDGQTFLPHCRNVLDKSMIDVDVTRELSKRLFRAMYLCVMAKMKVDSSYNVRDDMEPYFFEYRW